MDKNLNIINPEDKDYYDGKLYMVGLYPGAGAELKTFYVYGEYEGEALESVVAYLDLSSETGLLLDMDEVEDIVYDDYGEEYNNWLLEHPESDWFEFANEYLGYIYVDATMKGASQPYYVEGNYLRIEEVENKVEEDKEIKTEAEEKMGLDEELFNKFEKEVKLDFSNADMGILRLMYRRLDNLLMNVYDNSNADNLEENIKTILSKADVVVNNLPITNTLNEAFNLVNVVRSIVGSKLEEEFGYDFYYDNVYENKQIKTEANQYQELKDKHQKEFNEFPIGFAFSDEQFKEQMEKLGLTADDEDKVVGIGAGGFIRKDDVDKFNDMNARHRAEEEEAIKNDTTGEGYIKDMFDYELANHEYGYTYDLTDTLSSLGLSMEDINKDKRLQNGLNLALKRYDESKEVKTESVEPEENKKLDLKDRVKYAYENCNYSKRKDMPTVSDIMDYLGLDTYNNKLYNQISDILYELGYDWQLESKQIKSDKEIKTEDFKPATVEENPEIKNPHFWWEDKDTFIMEFDGGVDNEGDKYWYLVEYWADEDTYHFFKQYDYDTIVLNLPEDKKEQIINMMKAKMN